MSTYSSVRFIGFAIPTVPADIVPVGNPNGPGSVAGTYRALDDVTADIAARVSVIAQAAERAFSQIPADDDVLNVFLAPEFYWHGTRGPYAFAPGEEDPADIILGQLQEKFTAEKYPHSLFVLGSVISTEVADIDTVLSNPEIAVRNSLVKAFGEAWKESTGALNTKVFSLMEDFIQFAHANPKLEVRNRALIISTVGAASVEGDSFDTDVLTTEKYFASNEDFLLWDVTGAPVVTEQTVAYPVLDLSDGDLKKSPTDSKAIAVYADVTAAVEICLDHSDQRLRKSVFASPWPNGKNDIALHLIPSCGMQLHEASVAAAGGGYAFNCDGQYVLGTATPGTPQSETLSSVAGTYVDYSSGGDSPYQAHTQLTQVVTGPQGGYSTAVSAADATFAVPETDVTIVDLPDSEAVAHVFAGGPGAIHIYGLAKPLPLPR